MAKGEFDMLYLCAGGGGGLWYFPLLRGGQKKTLRLSGEASKKWKEKKNNEIIIAHPLDKLWMLPDEYKIAHYQGWKNFAQNPEVSEFLSFPALSDMIEYQYCKFKLNTHNLIPISNKDIVVNCAVEILQCIQQSGCVWPSGKKQVAAF